MKSVTLPLPNLGFIVSTRAALAAGIGLLVADRLTAQQRRTTGLLLATFGALTTIPALLVVRRGARRARRQAAYGVDRRLIGTARYPRKGDDLE